jgi:hypothetical protein
LRNKLQIRRTGGLCESWRSTTNNQRQQDK